MDTSVHPTHRYRLLAIVLVALALFATACGADGQVLEGDAALRSTNASNAETPARTEPTPVDITRAADPNASADPTEIAVVTTQEDEPEATPEPAAIPGEIKISEGGATVSMNAVRFTVGRTITEVDDDGGHWMSTVLDAESPTTVNWTLRDDNISFVDPDGNAYPVDKFYDVASLSQRSIELDGRSARVNWLQIQTPERVTSVAGWHLRVTGGDAIPAIIPLSGSAYAPHYPVQLRDGDESTLAVGRFGGCGDGATFETQIEYADVSLEARPYGRLLRVPPTERFVVIGLGLTGTAVSSAIANTSNCGLIGAWEDFVLMVDGRPTQAFFDGGGHDIEDTATITLPLTFQIPADAKSISLVEGNNDTSLASWDFELPTAVGEPGAELIPFTTDIEPLVFEPGPRPDQLSTTSFGDGGATDDMLFMDYTLAGALATNVIPDEFVRGVEENLSTRTWMIADLEVQNMGTGRWDLKSTNFVLEDPDGRPHAAAAIYDRTGKSQFSFTFDGEQFHEIRMAFETNGLIEDPAGWKVVVHNGNRIPVELPLVGPAPDSKYPVELSTGDTVNVGTEPFGSCPSGGSADLTMRQARVDIEGPSTGNLYDRANPDYRMVVVEFDLTNLVDATGTCGLIGAWPDFLLDVDGRRTQAVHDLDIFRLDPFETQVGVMSFWIPVDTQKIALLAGSGQGVVASWDLKNPGEVLQDFGAQTNTANQTVITLDETLLFAFGESTLQQSAFAPLNRVANVVNSESTGQIEIIGHTDSIGDDASNQALSQARAEAVAAALEDAGVDPAKLVVSGQGEASPVAPNTNDDGSDNPAGRQQNRRVEISFETS